MEVYGDLISAGYEKLAAHPANAFLSRTYYNTTDNKVYYYNGSSWIGLPSSIVSVGLLVSATNPAADYTTITLAIAAATAGQKIQLMDESYTETVNVNKQVHIFGVGTQSNIVGAITFAVGGENSTMKDIRTTEDITIAALVTGIQISDTYLATTKVINDNGSDNVWIAIGE